jgi:serine/threonine protein kinase
MDHERLASNTRLHGRYTIVRTRHISGVSVLYEAHDGAADLVDDRCAVKAMILDGGEVDGAEDFLARGRLIRGLVHRGIPATRDYFVVDRYGYLIMDFIDGENLDDILADSHRALSVRAVVRWGIALCDILHYLHTGRPDPLIFRDLKPANMMVDRQQDVWLVDFGIVEPLSRRGVCAPLGTDGYAAPEQYEGVLSPAIDIYALGATLHHLLSRRDPRLYPPFTFHGCPLRPANPEVPQVLEDVVMTAVSAEPSKRFASASEMADALRAVVRDLPA